MSVDQVVTRQIHRGMMHGVNEVGLHHGIVGMLHRIGCVDYVHLERIKGKNTNVYGQKTWSTDLHFRCGDVRIHLHASVVNASLLLCSVIPRP